MEELRHKIRSRLTIKYRSYPPEQLKRLSTQVGDALEQAKHTNKRVAVKGENGTFGKEELEDQLFAIDQAMKERFGT